MSGKKRPLAERMPVVDPERSKARQLASRAWFELRASRLRAVRAVRDLRSPPPRGRRGALKEMRPLVVSRTPLWTVEPGPERRLEAGKVHNLRIAARRLDDLSFGPGEVFSFWRHVGRPSRWAGYALGREVREGCLVPSVGGGLCQLSNALYDAALQAGFEIVERHAHSVVVPGSLAERGRDATVFWSYVDLRFRAPAGFGLRVKLDATHLEVALLAPGAPLVKGGATGGDVDTVVERTGPTGSCASCARTSCVSNAPSLARPIGRTAYLLDGVSPEIDAWVSAERGRGDVLLVPLDGARWGRARYAWTTEGFGAVTQAWPLAIRRAAESRRLAAQGAARQRAQLASDERLAAWMAARLGPEDLHLVVHQHLLPFLWRAGALGGRTVDVVMKRLPLRALQARLDAAARRHPESPTLADFRAPPRLADDEEAALRAARRVITPHAELASLFGPRAVKLPWRLPRGAARRRAMPDGDAVVFLGPVVGREGCYDLRAAMRDVDRPLVVAGRDLEGGFDWQRVVRASADPISDAALIVAPSWIGANPRPLLRALGRGVPVIASRACGLGALAGVTEIDAGDVAALQSSISSLSSPRSERPASARTSSGERP